MAGMSAALLLSEATTDWSSSCTRGRSSSYVYPNLIDNWILFAFNISLDIVTEVVKKCAKTRLREAENQLEWSTMQQYYY